MEPKSTYECVPSHHVAQVDSEFSIVQPLHHYPVKWVGKFCLSPTCIQFLFVQDKKKKVIAILRAFAELQLIATPRSIAMVMLWVLRLAGLMCTGCVQVWHPSSLGQGELSSLTYGWAVCVSSGVGTHFP